MKYLWGVVPLVVFIALALLLNANLGRDTEAMPSALVGRSVPEFDLPALASNRDQYDQEIFKGRWSLLNIWATWCPTCYVEHPYFIELARSGVAIVGVNYKDDDDKARRYLAELGNPYTEVVVDKQGNLALDLGVYGAPETFLVSPEGKILLRHAGEVNAQVWEEKFVPLMAQYEAYYSGREETP